MDAGETEASGHGGSPSKGGHPPDAADGDGDAGTADGGNGRLDGSTGLPGPLRIQAFSSPVDRGGSFYVRTNHPPAQVEVRVDGTLVSDAPRHLDPVGFVGVYPLPATTPTGGARTFG